MTSIYLTQYGLMQVPSMAQCINTDITAFTIQKQCLVDVMA